MMGPTKALGFTLIQTAIAKGLADVEKRIGAEIHIPYWFHRVTGSHGELHSFPRLPLQVFYLECHVCDSMYFCTRPIAKACTKIPQGLALRLGEIRGAFSFVGTTKWLGFLNAVTKNLETHSRLESKLVPRPRMRRGTKLVPFSRTPRGTNFWRQFQDCDCRHCAMTWRFSQEWHCRQKDRLSLVPNGKIAKSHKISNRDNNFGAPFISVNSTTLVRLPRKSTAPRPAVDFSNNSIRGIVANTGNLSDNAEARVSSHNPATEVVSDEIERGLEGRNIAERPARFIPNGKIAKICNKTPAPRRADGTKEND